LETGRQSRVIGCASRQQMQVLVVAPTQALDQTRASSAKVWQAISHAIVQTGRLAVIISHRPH
jgi:hypothetical protein